MIEKFSDPILVSKTYLPDKLKFDALTEQLWKSRWLTNNGYFHNEFSEKLKQFLRVSNLTLFTNGTLALDIAIKAFKLKGEIITTPFTFVATAHAISLNNIKPVFCDIELNTFNIDPNKIESLITENTSAILPVHVFGNPCAIDQIQKIADKYKLKVIYDAAHAFNVFIDGKSIVEFGDASMLSFHATKVFHTIEGGALVYPNSKLEKKFYLYKNFGIENEDVISMVGTNAKMNEFQAIMGLLNLEIVEDEIMKRKNIVDRYKRNLDNVAGISYIKDIPNVKHNWAYFPILVEQDKFGYFRDELYNKLKDYNVFARKYFYPLCSNIEPYRNMAKTDLSNANYVAQRVMTLPLYGDLSLSDVDKICLIIDSIRKK